MQAPERSGKRLIRRRARQALAEAPPQTPNGEFLRFLLVGGGAALLDLAIYLLLQVGGVPVPIAKGLSFVISSATAYQGNKHFTYRREAASMASVLLYALLYTGTLALNVAINGGVLTVLQLRESYEIGIAWTVATAVTAIINFVGTKLLVFRGAQLP